MKLLHGVQYLLVLATVVLLAQARKGDRAAGKGEKRRKQKQQPDAAPPAVVVDTPVIPADENAPVTVVEPPTDGAVDTGVAPSKAHNGKLDKKRDRAAAKAAKKAAKKAERKANKKAAKKAARKAEKKAAKKAEKKRLRQQERGQHQQQDGATPDEAADKAARKAERKAARKLRKQQQQQQDAPAGEIVSFDDIVGEKPPNPNPLPPVEGQPGAVDTATEGQTIAGGGGDVATGTGGSKQDRRRLKKEQKALRKQEKAERKERKHHKQERVCSNSQDCGHGHCCVEKKGRHVCKPSRKDEGQKCLDDCMCRAGLSCIPEEIAPGKERRFCKVRGGLDVDDTVGAVEDAVEAAINNDDP